MVDAIAELAALTLIRATLEQDRMKRRGVRMDGYILQAVAKAGKEASFQEIDLSVVDAYRKAAYDTVGFRLQEGRAKPGFPPTFGTRPDKGQWRARP